MPTPVLIKLETEVNCCPSFDHRIIDLDDAIELQSVLTSNPISEAYLCGYTDQSRCYSSIKLTIIDDQKVVDAFRIVYPHEIRTHQIYDAIMNPEEDSD